MYLILDFIMPPIILEIPSLLNLFEIYSRQVRATAQGGDNQAMY
jgi:hypothetical protein